MLLGASVTAAAGAGTETAADLSPAPVVPEAFVTDMFPDANLDSVAVWRPPAGVAEVLVTAKEGDVLYALNAETGALIRTLGAARVTVQDSFDGPTASPSKATSPSSSSATTRGCRC
jgi:hypothetical protein